MGYCDERGGGGGGAAESAAFEGEVEGDFTDAGGGALGDSFDCFGDFGAVGGCEGAFFFDVLGGGVLAVGRGG